MDVERGVPVGGAPRSFHRSADESKGRERRDRSGRM